MPKYLRRIRRTNKLKSGLPRDLDLECAPLVMALNSLPGVRTSCSCCGHLKDPFEVYFYCKNALSLSIIARACDDNYGGSSWKIEVETAESAPETYPMTMYRLCSKNTFRSWKQMNFKVWTAVGRLYFWADPYYKNHLSNRKPKSIIEENNKEVESK